MVILIVQSSIQVAGPCFTKEGRKINLDSLLKLLKKNWEIKNISDFNFNFVLIDFKAQQNEDDILETMLSTSKEPEQLIKPETP